MPVADRYKEQVAELERRADHDGWDGPPALYILSADERPTKVAVHNRLWEMARPPDVLAVMAHTAESGHPFPREYTPPRPSGIAFMSESWMVEMKAPVEMDEIADSDRRYAAMTMSLAGEHRLYEHRNRIEARTVYVLAEGREAMYVHKRGRKPQWMEEGEDAEEFGEEAVHGHMEGDVPDAARRLLRAIQKQRGR
jgi:hypothetical protein